MNPGDRALHMHDQRLHIGGARGTVVDDEVRVFQGYRGIADAKTLESCAFDQLRRVMLWRIGEYRSTAPLADGLGLLALLQQFADGIGIDAGCTFELEPGADEPFVVRSLHAAIAVVIVGGLPRAP